MKYSVKESELRKIIRKILKEGVVDHFTPYTKADRERNFIPFTDKDTRTPEERNPSYAAALKAAAERRRQRELQKKQQL